MADYRIELGIGLKDSDFNDIKNKIKSLENDGIKIKLDTNTVDSQIKGIKAQLQGLDNIRIDLGTDIKIDSNVAVKSAQQIGNKIGDSVTKSVKQSINIDDVIDKQVTKLMKKFDISGEKGSKSFDSIKQALIECRNELNTLKNGNFSIDEEVFGTSAAVDKVTKALAKQMNAVNDLGNEYIELANYITEFNRKNSKIHIPDFIKQERGDDYKSNKSSLGIAFTTGKGQDFADFITELNGNLGQTIDLTKGEAEAFDELFRKVEIGKKQREAAGRSDKYIYESLSTEEILEHNGVNRNEIYDDVMSIVNTIGSAEKQIAKASSEATNIVALNEEKKQQAYKATTDTVMYHAGIVSKLNKAETNGRFYGSNRGTGYFGTGHYFVDSATKHELDNSPSYRNLPYTSIDISQYDNLFPATTDEIADKLHSFLHNLTRFTQGADFDVSDLFVQFREVFGDTIMDVKEFGSRLDQLKTFMSNSSLSDRSDSVSTQFMKSLGYGGVNTRGTRFADTTYGTVIYDLKEESVLQANITDELQKQGQMLEKINYERGQVFDKETDAKIQSKLDEEIKRKETIAEFEKSFDSTNLDNAYESLGKIESRVKEIDDAISSCNHSLNNLDQEYDNELRELEDLGLDADDIFLMQDKDEWKATRSEVYQDYINELSQEKERLQSEIPSLEETYKRESQLANEAYEQAKKVVDQRHKEAQLAQEVANAVVQSEERKQQAHQETAKVFSSIQKGNFQKVFDPADDDLGGMKNTAKSVEQYFKSLQGVIADTVSVKERFDADGNLDGFTVSLRNANGEAERLRYTFNAAAEDGKAFFKYTGGSIDDNVVGKQIEKSVKMASDLQIELDKIKTGYSDTGATKPIKNASYIASLDEQYKKVEKAIIDVRNADSSTFTSMVSNAKKEKAALESMVKVYKNADNVSNSLKGTDFASGVKIRIEELGKFKAQATDFPQMTKTINELDKAIADVGDKSSLDSFTDQLKVARAELAKVKAETIATNRKEKVGIDVSGATSRIANIQRISPEIDKFKAEINGAEVSVESLLNDLSRVNTSDDFSVINKKLNAFEKAAESAGIAVKELGKSASNTDLTKEINQDLNNFIKLQKQIENTRFEIGKLEITGDSTNQISELKRQLKELENAYDELMQAFMKKISVNADVVSFNDVVNKLDNGITEATRNAENRLEQFKAKYADVRAELAKSIKLDIELGNYEDEMDGMISKYNMLSNANEDLLRSYNATKTAHKAMVDASDANTGDEVADRERLIQAEKEYHAALEKTNNLIKKQARADKIDADATRLQDNRDIFQAKIDSWMTKNSAATKRFGADLLDLRAKAEKADQVDLNHLEKQLTKIDKAADKAGLKMQSFGDRIKTKAKEYMAYLSVAEVFMWVEQAARAMFDTVLEIDTAMTGLYRVTDLTAAQYDTLFNNMIDSAKEYGATLNDIINATTDWVRAGFEADTALGLAEVTTMYQHISDLDYDTAAENLITAYNGFKDELNGAFGGDTVAAVEYIADIFNQLDNTFAVTSAGLGEALTRSASALDLAGNTIQETAG